MEPQNDCESMDKIEHIGPGEKGGGYEAQHQDVQTGCLSLLTKYLKNK